MQGQGTLRLLAMAGIFNLIVLFPAIHDRVVSATAVPIPLPRGEIMEAVGAVYDDGPASDLSLSKRVIVIDPGHGGIDPGTVGPDGVTEAEITFALAMRVKSLLEESGVLVVFTRYGDFDIGLYERARFSDRVRADVFVSLHVNGSDYRSVRGVETYYFPGAEESARLAEAVHRRLVRATGGPDRGIIPEDFVVIREPAAPAVLVECGYLSNREEAFLLVSDAHQDRLARAVAEGILAFLAE